MKNVLWVIAGLFVANGAFAETTVLSCRDFRDPRGNVYSDEQLEKMGLKELGGWQTDDIYEFRDFPAPVKAVTKAYARSRHMRLNDFLVLGGFVEALKRSPKTGQPLGYIVGIVDETTSSSEPMTYSGAVYELVADRMVRIAEISRNRIVNCR